MTAHDHAILGGLPHGTFDDIALQADWYTGDCVFEAPGEHKSPIWNGARRESRQLDNGDVIAHASIDTPKGRSKNRCASRRSERRIDFDITFHWDDWGKGVLAAGPFHSAARSLRPGPLRLATTNGGGRESFPLAGRTIDHGAPVSFLVSSSHGLGMTEGWAEIGDDKTRLRIEVDAARRHCWEC